MTVSQYGESSEFRKTEELARAAFALQELRYRAWTALKHWDNMVLRKAQRTGPTAAAMEAMRAALPLEREDDDA